MNFPFNPVFLVKNNLNRIKYNQPYLQDDKGRGQLRVLWVWTLSGGLGRSLGGNGLTAVGPSGANVHGAVIAPGANGHYGYFGSYTNWNYTGPLGTTCRGNIH